MIAVPDGTGLGCEPDAEVMERYRVPDSNIGRGDPMSQSIQNWLFAAEDAVSYLKETQRTYPTTTMLAIVDHLCLRGEATREDLVRSFGRLI